MRNERRGLPNRRVHLCTESIGALRFQLRLPLSGAQVAYRFAGETLQGAFEGGGWRPMTRVANLHQIGCGSQAGKLPPVPPAAGPRDQLTADELLKTTDAGTGPVHNAYFLPVSQSAPARHAFKGTVKIEATTVFKARHGCAGLAESLPEFTTAFFTHGEHLVPVIRDILQPPSMLILSPGRVWSARDDQGMSRASFPFVLVSPYSNETHNGLATFLYDDTRVSALRVQVVQETASWAKYDGWGQAAMSYTPGLIRNEEALQAQFAAELQQQTPIQPWSTLQVSPGTQWPAHFDGEAAPEDVSASGLVVDGAIYLHGCETRYGPYPYCRQMRHGVFSVTKSLGATVALLRLAQKYGDEVFDLKIKDYVPVTATHDGWERVTFADALNMATGIGDLAPQREPNQPFADEGKPKMNQWGRARTTKEKLAVCFSYGKYPWGPGEVLRYNSTQTFVLAAAMDSFLKRKEGPHAHLWDIITAEVFQPLGIFHAPMMHTQETSGERDIPLLSVGLYPTIDDIAKLTTLLQNGGQHQGQQLLHDSGKIRDDVSSEG
ncbi:MAG: serine hydrolase [Deltaproteobacteria bacterium]|nr:serine hydrolase [Deltaproteobacteria bacterium]